MLRKMISLVLVLALALSAVPAGAPAEGAEKRILVIETCDIHGHILNVSSGGPERFEYPLAYIAHVVNEARSSGQYDDVILLDGGDIYQGTPLSFMTGGAVMRCAFDAMKYDAVALGNHEFDWDVCEYAADRDGTMPPYELGDWYGDPSVPVLASDLYDASSGERVPFTRDYVVLEKAGLRIAVIGYIPDYRRTIMTSKIAPYTIDPSLDRLNALVREVYEKEQPAAAVVLVHDNPTQVAKAVDPALVQLVCGGHTNHELGKTAPNGVAYIQGGYHGRGYASAVLAVGADGTVRVEDPAYTDIMADRDALTLTDENAARLDPVIASVSVSAWEAVQEQMTEVLGWIDRPIETKPYKTLGASSAGNWITAQMLAVARPQGAVAAFYNSGGIRADFRIPSGRTTREITVNDVYTIVPFGNTLLIYDLSGAELAKLLADGLKSPNYGDQVAGLAFTYSATGTPDQYCDERDYTILSVTLDDGTEVDIHDTETLYRVCIIDFCATVPGSVFENREPVIPAADSPVDHESIVAHLRRVFAENGGYIAVDDSPRGTEVTPE